MHMRSRFIPAFFGFIVGLGVSSPALAEMNLYNCQLDPAKPAGLTVSYDTNSGQFALVDFFGSPNLPVGVQVKSFSPNAANLSFVLEYYSGSALSQRENYALDFAQMSAILNRETFVASGGSTGQVGLSGACQLVDPATATQTVTSAANPPFVPILPPFYSEVYAEVIDPITAAIAVADQRIATGQPASGNLAPLNSVCAGSRSDDVNYIEATWCATTALESEEVPYGGILGFVSVNADYGRKPAWCTAIAREGDTGIGQSIEIKFWLVREPGPIRSLVIRSGTGMAGDAPDKHARPSLLRVESSDRSWAWPLQDNVEFQAITFDQPFQSEWVRVVIEDAYPGSSWSNICVSDLLAVFGE